MIHCLSEVRTVVSCNQELFTEHLPRTFVQGAVRSVEETDTALGQQDGPWPGHQRQGQVTQATINAIHRLLWGREKADVWGAVVLTEIGERVSGL